MKKIFLLLIVIGLQPAFAYQDEMMQLPNAAQMQEYMNAMGNQALPNVDPAVMKQINLLRQQKSKGALQKSLNMVNDIQKMQVQVDPASCNKILSEMHSLKTTKPTAAPQGLTQEHIDLVNETDFDRPEFQEGKKQAAILMQCAQKGYIRPDQI